MNYRLKSTVLADVDLAVHAAPAHWLTEARDPRGRWTHGGGSIWGIAGSGQGGKHASYADPDRAIADSYRGLHEEQSVSYTRVDWDGLLQKADDPNALPTEREKALKEVTVHLEQMRRHVERTSSGVRVTRTHTRTSLRLRRKEVKAEEFGAETTKHATAVEVATKAAEIGARVAGASAGLLGVQESEQISEAFAKIAENPGVHAALTVAVMLLISTLIARFQKVLRERRDRKVAKARGEI